MVERKIAAIKREAFTPAKVEEIKEVEHELSRRFLSGGMSLEDFRRETDALPRAGQLIVSTPDELGQALKSLGFDSEFVEENVVHETAHFNTSQEVGFHAQLGIQFVKPNRLSNFRNVFTSITIPDDFTDEAARMALRAVTEAPGKDMSPSDKASLPEFKPREL